MPTKASDNDSGSIDHGQAVSAVFRLLSHHRRRIAIQYLATQAGTTPVADVADQIALIEGEHTKDRYARICVSLAHNHLPMMSEAEVVAYNRDEETVELRGKATDLLSHIELATTADTVGEES